MNFEEQYLQQITTDVCQSMLGLELTPMESPFDTTQQLVASVEIHGARHTIVEVFAPDELIGSIAEVMFSSDRGSLSEDDIRDAFCEIANMIGGNVKGSYGEEASLSLPAFGKANETVEKLPSDSLRTSFECCGHPLTIVLREIQAEPQAAGTSAH